MAFQPPSLIEPGVSSPTRNGFSAGAVLVAAGGAEVSRCAHEAMKRKTIAARARFMVRGFYGLPLRAASGTRRPRRRSISMDDIDRNNDAEYDEDDEQIEQMIIENGILLHSLAALLVRKGVLTQ